MKPRFDPCVIFPDDVDTLRGMTGHFTNATARLMIHGLVDYSLYRLALNPASHVAMADIHEGARIRVTEQHPLPVLHGREGEVVRVSSAPTGMTVEVRMDIRTEALWCFYESRLDIARLRAFSLGHIVCLTPLPEEGGRWSGHTRESAQEIGTPDGVMVRNSGATASVNHTPLAL